MAFFHSLYNFSPIFLQNVMCSLYGFKEAGKRYGPFFDRKLLELEQSQFLSKVEIENYKDEQIRLLVEYCLDFVPYYRSLFQELKLTKEDVKTVRDLEKVPVLTKEILLKRYDEFIPNDNKMSKVYISKTSGSTGTPLQIRVSKEAMQFQWAIWWRFRKRFNVDLGELHCNFSGRPVVPLSQMNPPFWRFNRAFNQYLVSMQHITQGKIKDILNFMNEREFLYFVGYPSIISNFCNILNENELRVLNPPKYIFSGCEKLYSNQKYIIENTLNTSVLDQYGMTEMCANASQCEKGMYHEDFEFCHIGVQSDERLTMNQGRVLGTGFANYAFPLINYDVGDYVSVVDEECSCGRKSTVFKDFEGRKEDYIITPENLKVLRFDYIFKDVNNIQEAQVVQFRLGEIVIRIVKNNNYSLSAEKVLKKAVRKWISPTLNVVFEYPIEIERTRTGKFRAVISKL
jgi:phenylacetate-CoA ligase